MTKNKWIGCLIGFAGVILINLNGSSIDMSMKLTGEGFIFLSAVSYAIASVIIGLLGNGRITTVNPQGILVLLHLSLVSAVAYTIWAILLKHNPVSKVAIYGFMTPVCGVILSALLLQETSQAFGLTGFISLFLVCLGIYSVNRT